MKKIVLIIILSVFFFKAYAQEEDDKIRYLSFGPILGFKGGVNGTEVPDPRQNGFALNVIPDIGLRLYYPLSNEINLGLMLDAQYSAYSFVMKNFDNGDQFKFKYGYITFCPYFNYEYVHLGFNFGFPVYANFGEDIDVGKLGFMAEIRVGGMYPIFSDETGNLNIIAYAGYFLSGMFKDYPTDDPLKDKIPLMKDEKVTDKHNFRPLSITIGINYLFNF